MFIFGTMLRYMGRVTRLPPFVVSGAATLADAFDRAFGEDALRRAHGDSLQVSSWSACERVYGFEIDVHAVPAEVRRVFCGDRLRITCRQRVNATPERITVRDRLRMHFVGRELFVVRPRFSLACAPDGVLLTAEVEQHALLPPPLCNIVEAFMDASSRSQLERFRAALVTT